MKQKKSLADPLKVVALSRKDLKKGRYKGGSGDDGEKNEDEDEGVPNQDHKKAYDVWSSKGDCIKNNNAYIHSPIVNN